MHGFSICPDKGPDMLAMDHFLSYEKHINISTDYDLCHETKNAAKHALKTSELWSTIVRYAAGNNCVFGSTLSPARLLQIKEAVAEYFEQHDETDEYFQYYLPMLCEQMKLDVTLGDAGCDKVLVATITAMVTVHCQYSTFMLVMVARRRWRYMMSVFHGMVISIR